MTADAADQQSGALPCAGRSDPWAQYAEETDAAFAAFTVYRDLGPKRSLNKSYQRSGGAQRGNARAPGCWRRWCTRHDWPARARAYDRHLLTVRQGAIERVEAADAEHWAERRKTQRENLHELLGGMIGKLRVMLDFPAARKVVEQVNEDCPNRCPSVVTIEPARWSFRDIAQAVRMVQTAGAELAAEGALEGDLGGGMGAGVDTPGGTLLVIVEHEFLPAGDHPAWNATRYGAPDTPEGADPAEDDGMEAIAFEFKAGQCRSAPIHVGRRNLAGAVFDEDPDASCVAILVNDDDDRPYRYLYAGDAVYTAEIVGGTVDFDPEMVEGYPCIALEARSNPLTPRTQMSGCSGRVTVVPQ